jgi:hypothetical protein
VSETDGAAGSATVGDDADRASVGGEETGGVETGEGAQDASARKRARSGRRVGIERRE